MKKYYGVFDKMKTDFPGYIKEYPLYYDEAADLYDQISVVYDDYPAFLQQAQIHNGPILELCCGSGRITLPLLKNGFKITAVDLSGDMLSNLKQQLDKGKKYQQVKKNLRLVTGDMSSLELDEKFNLIIIGATSIRLLGKDFVEFLNQMYDQLNPGGCLYFNFESIPILENSGEVLEPMNVIDLEGKDGKLSLLCFQRITNYNERKSVVNFLKINPGSTEKILLTQTEYRIFGVEDIKTYVGESKFKSCILEQVNGSINYNCKMVKN